MADEEKKDELEEQQERSGREKRRLRPESEQEEREATTKGAALERLKGRILSRRVEQEASSTSGTTISQWQINKAMREQFGLEPDPDNPGEFRKIQLEDTGGLVPDIKKSIDDAGKKGTPERAPIVPLSEKPLGTQIYVALAEAVISAKLGRVGSALSSVRRAGRLYKAIRKAAKDKAASKAPAGDKAADTATRGDKYSKAIEEFTKSVKLQRETETGRKLPPPIVAGSSETAASAIDELLQYEIAEKEKELGREITEEEKKQVAEQVQKDLEEIIEESAKEAEKEEEAERRRSAAEEQRKREAEAARKEAEAKKKKEDEEKKLRELIELSKKNIADANEKELLDREIKKSKENVAKAQEEEKKAAEERKKAEVATEQAEEDVEEIETEIVRTTTPVAVTIDEIDTETTIKNIKDAVERSKKAFEKSKSRQEQLEGKNSAIKQDEFFENERYAINVISGQLLKLVKDVRDNAEDTKTSFEDTEKAVKGNVDGIESIKENIKKDREKTTLALASLRQKHIRENAFIQSDVAGLLKREAEQVAASSDIAVKMAIKEKEQEERNRLDESAQLDLYQQIDIVKADRLKNEADDYGRRVTIDAQTVEERENAEYTLLTVPNRTTFIVRMYTRTDEWYINALPYIGHPDVYVFHLKTFKVKIENNIKKKGSGYWYDWGGKNTKLTTPDFELSIDNTRLLHCDSIQEVLDNDYHLFVDRQTQWCYVSYSPYYSAMPETRTIFTSEAMRYSTNARSEEAEVNSDDTFQGLSGKYERYPCLLKEPKVDKKLSTTIGQVIRNSFSFTINRALPVWVTPIDAVLCRLSKAVIDDPTIEDFQDVAVGFLDNIKLSEGRTQISCRGFIYNVAAEATGNLGETYGELEGERARIGWGYIEVPLKKVRTANEEELEKEPEETEPEKKIDETKSRAEQAIEHTTNLFQQSVDRRAKAFKEGGRSKRDVREERDIQDIFDAIEASKRRFQASIQKVSQEVKEDKGIRAVGIEAVVEPEKVTNWKQAVSVATDSFKRAVEAQKVRAQTAVQRNALSAIEDSGERVKLSIWKALEQKQKDEYYALDPDYIPSGNIEAVFYEGVGAFKLDKSNEIRSDLGDVVFPKAGTIESRRNNANLSAKQLYKLQRQLQQESPDKLPYAFPNESWVYDSDTGIIRILFNKLDDEDRTPVFAIVKASTQRLGDIIIDMLKKGRISYTQRVWNKEEMENFLASKRNLQLNYFYEGGKIGALVDELMKNTFAYIIQDAKGRLTIRQVDQTYNKWEIPSWSITKYPEFSYSDSKDFINSMRTEYDIQRDKKKTDIYEPRKDELALQYLAEGEKEFQFYGEDIGAAEGKLGQLGQLVRDRFEYYSKRRLRVKLEVGVDLTRVSLLDKIKMDIRVNFENLAPAYDYWKVLEIDTAKGSLVLEEA